MGSRAPHCLEGEEFRASETSVRDERLCLRLCIECGRARECGTERADFSPGERDRHPLDNRVARLMEDRQSLLVRARHPSSVKVGIASAGSDVIFVEVEGDTAMTRPRHPTHTVAFVDEYCAY